MQLMSEFKNIQEVEKSHSEWWGSIGFLALKPLSINLETEKPGSDESFTAGESAEIITTGHHDPCVGIRAVPIAEAMLTFTLMNHYLRNRRQNADVDKIKGWSRFKLMSPQSRKTRNVLEGAWIAEKLS